MFVFCPRSRMWDFKFASCLTVNLQQRAVWTDARMAQSPRGSGTCEARGRLGQHVGLCSAGVGDNGRGCGRASAHGAGGFFKAVLCAWRVVLPLVRTLNLRSSTSQELLQLTVFGNRPALFSLLGSSISTFLEWTTMVGQTTGCHFSLIID